jgi:hypothetical protein
MAPFSPSFSPSDLVYVTTEYHTMAVLCDGRAHEPAHVETLVAEGRLPAATYVLPSGERRYPPDYFALVDEFGVDGLADGFHARYLAAGGTPDEAEEDWLGYLSGQFGVCLRVVAPESMVAKNRLITTIERLRVAPGDAAWSGAMREAVDALDALLRPYTDFDRERWGETGRDRHVTRVREQWPSVFDHTVQGA